MIKPYYLLELYLENISPFSTNAVLDFSNGKGNWQQWTVILGDNGTGKTTLLQAIAALEIIIEPAHDNSLNYNIGLSIYNLGLSIYSSSERFKRIEQDKNASISLNLFNGLDSEYNYLSKYDINIKFAKQGPSYNGKFYSMKGELPIYSYGASRLMDKSDLSTNYTKHSNTLFDEYAKLINAEEWLLQLDYASSKESEIKEYAMERSREVRAMLIDLLPGITDIRFTLPTRAQLKSTVEFETQSGWVRINQLSLGYKSMVAWMIDLAARMFQRYPDSINPLAEPAVVLVDEIDLHLHPKWQREIFNLLSEKFSKTQFVVTAHSPLVVQSVPDNTNIVVLKRQDNCIVIDNTSESVKDWRLDQIMASELFGINSSRGPETAEWMQERKDLIKKPTLTDEERSRLNYLNRRAHALPTAQSVLDIEAMKVINEAADYLKK